MSAKLLRMYKLFLFGAGLLLACCLLLPAVSLAEDLATLPSESVAVEQDYDRQWSEIRHLIRARSTAKLEKAFNMIYSLDRAIPERRTESFAMDLIDEARISLKSGKKDEAEFFIKAAVVVAPRSSRVMMQASKLQFHHGSGAFFSRVKDLLYWLWHSPVVLMPLGRSLIYPVMWSLTLGIFLVYILWLGVRVPHLAHLFQRRLPDNSRRLSYPFVLLILILPCFISLLVAICVWTCVMYFWLPQGRKLGAWAGLLLILWGNVIPVREQLNGWLHDGDMRALLDKAQGHYFTIDDNEIFGRLLNRRSGDAFVWYSYGVWLKRKGEFLTAAKAFVEAERLWGKQPWTVAQQGEIALLQGRYASAESLFGRAALMGLDTKEFNYNFSRLQLVKMEERDHGGIAKVDLLEMIPPTSMLIKSAFSTPVNIRKRYREVSKSLLAGVSAREMILLGMLMIILGLAVKQEILRQFFKLRKTQEAPRYYVMALKLVPGGSWVLAGKLGRSIITFSVFSFLMMPLMNVLPDSYVLTRAIGSYITVYGAAVALFAVCILYCSVPKRVPVAVKNVLRDPMILRKN